jgi:hypothetical protein
MASHQAIIIPDQNGISITKDAAATSFQLTE